MTAGPRRSSPFAGVWYDPDQSGNGYGMDYQNGVLLVQIYSYLANGTAQWYLAAGDDRPTTCSTGRSTGTPAASAPAVPPAPLQGSRPPVGNDGEIIITFTSARSANVVFPGGRQSTIQPYFQP